MGRENPVQSRLERMPRGRVLPEEWSLDDRELRPGAQPTLHLIGTQQAGFRYRPAVAIVVDDREGRQDLTEIRHAAGEIQRCRPTYEEHFGARRDHLAQTDRLGV